MSFPPIHPLPTVEENDEEEVDGVLDDEDPEDGEEDDLDDDEEDDLDDVSAPETAPLREFSLTSASPTRKTTKRI